MDIEQASENVKEKLSKVLKKKAEETVSINKEGTKWVAHVEVLEEVFLPEHPESRSMSDIIGLYEVQLSESGDIIGWKKLKSRKRENLSG